MRLNSKIQQFIDLSSALIQGTGDRVSANPSLLFRRGWDNRRILRIELEVDILLGGLDNEDKDRTDPTKVVHILCRDIWL